MAHGEPTTRVRAYGDEVRKVPSDRTHGTLMMDLPPLRGITLHFTDDHYESAKTVVGRYLGFCVQHGDTKADVVARALLLMPDSKFEVLEGQIYLNAKWPTTSTGVVPKHAIRVQMDAQLQRDLEEHLGDHGHDGRMGGAEHLTMMACQALNQGLRTASFSGDSQRNRAASPPR